ncbi:hypothetical protein FisN_UnNu082, partial [Fistulifera solaris]
MSDEGDKIATLRYYPLNDKIADTGYDGWRYKTMAYFKKRGWADVIENVMVKIPTKEEMEAEKVSKENKLLFKHNQEVFEQLVIACEEVPLGLVMRADGDARLAFKYLDRKYARNSEEDLAEALAAFSRCKLAKKEDDPDKWFMETDRLNNRLAAIGREHRKSEVELKAHYTGNLPKEYGDLLTKLSGKLADYDVFAIEEEIRNKWKRDFKPSDEEAEKKEKNHALNVENGGNKKKGAKKKFKGRCRNCGEIGHKAFECKKEKKLVCYNCGKEGHKANECPDKTDKKDDDKKDLGMFVGMSFCCEVNQGEGKFVGSTGTEEKFLLDSGATCHVVVDETMLTDVQDKRDVLIVGNGKEVTTVKSGTLTLRTESGLVKLLNVRVAPTFAKNIISTGSLEKQGNKIEMSNGVMTITDASGKHSVKIPRRNGTLYYLEATPVSEGVDAVESTSKLDINEAHEKYGHASNTPLKEVSKQLGIVLTGEKKTCEACAYAKAKAKAVCKSTLVKATKKGERLFVDTSGPYKMSLAKNSYWILVVDDLTRKAWSFFVDKKSKIKDVMEKFLDKLSGCGVEVKFVRCDNAGENDKMKEMCEKKGITMEFTAPHTPQMNGVAERKFVTIRDKAVAMMLAAKLTDEHQGKLWPEAVNSATRLDNAVPNRNMKESPDLLWYGSQPNFLQHLVQWGRVGYMTIRDQQPKLSKKSVQVVMVGYADLHSGDTYRVFKPESETVVLSRDVTWADWHGSSGSVAKELRMFATDMDIDTTDDQIGEEVAQVPTEAGRKEYVEPEVAEETESAKDSAPVATRRGRLVRELARLRTSYNVANPDGEEAFNEAVNMILSMNFEDLKNDQYVGGGIDDAKQFVLNAELMSDPGEPETVKEALSGKEAVEWKAALMKEIENFLKRKAWKKELRKKMKAKGRKPVSSKWIFKKKNEVTGLRFKARVCARGFVQIPGVDFNLSHSPVASDTSVRMVLLVVLYKRKDKWIAELIDVEAAFLEAGLDEEVYLEWPYGLVEFGYITEEEAREYVILLDRAMYGLVQSPRQYYLLYGSELEKLGLKQCAADPCVWYKEENGETVLIIVVYVDDCIVAGPKEQVEWFKTQIKKRFNIAELGPIKKHLGVWYERKCDAAGEYYEVRMDDYKKAIVKDWKALYGELKVEKTPGYPNESLVKSEDEPIDLEVYRKFLGRIMWMVRKVAPECSNATRELAMFMDKPGKEHWKAMKRLVGYLASTDVHLKLREPLNLKVYAWVDSNFATNKETRKSVTGFFVTVGGGLCVFSSKLQPSVTLSSTEAEYYAASTCATDIKFLQMLFEELFPKELTRPGVLLEDNTGAIFLMENQVVGNRTKHIDIRMHHIREMMSKEGNMDPRLVVKFVKSENNIADIATKNVTEKVHDRLAPIVREGLMREFIRAILAADRE